MSTEAQPAFPDGPFLQCALVCERVLTEQDGVKSAIRMVDRVTRTVQAVDPPTEMQPFDHQLYLLIRLKAGTARGSMPLQVRFHKPNFETSTPPPTNIYFEGEDDRGADIVIPMNMRLTLTGVHWISVELDGTRITRVPLRVIYNPVSLPPQASTTDPDSPQ